MYNATVYRMQGDQVISTFVAEVDGAGLMLRSNAVQCTGLEGSPRYDAYVRRAAFAGSELHIVADGGEGYRAQLRALALPAGYRV